MLSMPLYGREWRLQRIPILRVGCPREIAARRENAVSAGPLIVEKNHAKLGLVASTGYYPPGLVGGGEAYRAKLMADGITKAWGYVEAGTAINADDEIGCRELMTGLGRLLSMKLYGSEKGPVSPLQASFHNVLEVYPFENYMVYSQGDKLWRQHFQLDPKERKMSLSGEPTPVRQAYVTACTESMPYVDTGNYPRHYAPVKGNGQTSTRGGASSSLVVGMIRQHGQLMRVLNEWLDYVKNGSKIATPFNHGIRPSFAPVDVFGGRVGGVFAAEGLNPFDYALWLARKGQGVSKPSKTGADAN